jgi:hypothetical protein
MITIIPGVVLPANLQLSAHQTSRIASHRPSGLFICDPMPPTGSSTCSSPSRHSYQPTTETALFRTNPSTKAPCPRPRIHALHHAIAADHPICCLHLWERASGYYLHENAW